MLKPLYVGQKFSTTKCGEVEVTQIKDRRNIEVKFFDTGYIVTTTFDNLCCGEIRDILRPSVYNIGIVGTRAVVGKDVEYDLWHSMLRRCYGEQEIIKNPTYIGCCVSEPFKEYLKFKDWCNMQQGFNREDEKGRKFHLDKDILIKGNKIYSENTCCFVPAEINSLFTHNKSNKGSCPSGVNQSKTNKKYLARINKQGVRENLGSFQTPEEAFQAYKIAKEAYIKEIANKWKGEIDSRVYKALINYEVE